MASKIQISGFKENEPPSLVGLCITFPDLTLQKGKPNNTAWSVSSASKLVLPQPPCCTREAVSPIIWTSKPHFHSFMIQLYMFMAACYLSATHRKYLWIIGHDVPNIANNCISGENLTTIRPHVNCCLVRSSTLFAFLSLFSNFYSLVTLFRISKTML